MMNKVKTLAVLNLTVVTVGVDGECFVRAR